MNQLDLIGLPLDAAMTRRIALPQPREVRKPKLRDVLADISRDELLPVVSDGGDHR